MFLQQSGEATQLHNRDQFQAFLPNIFHKVKAPALKDRLKGCIQLVQNIYSNPLEL